MRVCLMLLSIMLGSLLWLSSAQAGEWDFSGKSSLQTRYFPYDPATPAHQKMRPTFSGTLEPELLYEFDDGDNRLSFTPFVRLDGNDKKRTHFDIRELSWLHLGNNWDLSIGINKVFWGVTESVHLVDIINQTDGVEDITGEDKLGQPMINLNVERIWGTISLFALPGFRPRTFHSHFARLNGPLLIDTGTPVYASRQGNRHVDWAARISMTFGDMDIALSHFQGTSREPRLLASLRGLRTILTPYYDQIGQTGLESQLTTANTLWKFEGITRTGQGKRFYATVTGFEHTLYGVFGSVADIGLLMEYLYDNRDARFAPPILADHDVFAGIRLAMNDTQDSTLLLGGSWDHHNRTGFVNLEAERRMTDHLKLSLNGRFFVHVANTDPLHAIRNDDFVELTLNWFF